MCTRLHDHLPLSHCTTCDVIIVSSWWWYSEQALNEPSCWSAKTTILITNMLFGAGHTVLPYIAVANLSWIWVFGTWLPKIFNACIQHWDCQSSNTMPETSCTDHSTILKHMHPSLEIQCKYNHTHTPLFPLKLFFGMNFYLDPQASFSALQSAFWEMAQRSVKSNLCVENRVLAAQTLSEGFFLFEKKTYCQSCAMLLCRPPKTIDLVFPGFSCRRGKQWLDHEATVTAQLNPLRRWSWQAR